MLSPISLAPLLGSGADPNAQNAEGHTPLVEAVIEKKIACAELLRKAMTAYKQYPGSEDFTVSSCPVDWLT